jgi:hypothetical protein
VLLYLWAFYSLLDNDFFNATFQPCVEHKRNYTISLKVEIEILNLWILNFFVINIFLNVICQIHVEHRIPLGAIKSYIYIYIYIYIQLQVEHVGITHLPHIGM